MKNKKGKNYISIGIIVVLIGILMLVSACQKTYTVTLDTGKIIEIKSGEKLKIEDPTKEGYTFDGWYLDGKIFDLKTKITKDIKLKAKWKINQYTVTFNTGISVINESVDYNKTVKEPEIPIREGYRFIGWYINDEIFNLNTKIKKDIEVTAKWERVEQVFKPINYANYVVEHYKMDLNGNFIETPYEIEYLTAEENSKIAPKPKNYEGFTTPAIKQGIAKKDGSTVIQYFYIRNKYNLTIEKDNGIKDYKGDGTYYYEEKVELDYTLNDGYTFNGFSDTVLDNIYTMPASDTTLKLITTPNIDTPYIIKHYKMNLDGEYAEEPDEIDELVGTTDTKVIPKTKNYIGFTSPKEVEININGDGSTILEYKYKRNKYELTINKDFGYIDALGSGTYYYEQEINLSYKLKPGYSFIKYSENVKDNIYKMPAKDVTLNIISKPNDDTIYTVKHYKMNLNGEYDNTPSEIETLKGTTDTKVTPKVKNYTGFTSPSEVEINIDGNGNTILEYKYKRNKYNLVLNKDIGIDTITGDGEYYYETLVNVKASLKPGYAFVGWSNNEKSLEFKYKLLDNTTLTASSKAINYNIKYDYDGGKLNNDLKNPSTYTVEDEITLNKPEKVGYTFVKWIINDKDSLDGVIKNSIGELNVKAVFTPNTNTPYKVLHYQMNLDGIGYTLVDTDELTGISDSKITPDTKTYEGFQTPNKVTVKINADGTTIVKYEYIRNKYKLTLKTSKGIDNVSESNTYYYGETVNINASVSKGYVFNKWEETLEENNVKKGTLNDNTYIMPASNVTLTATATPIEVGYSVELYYMDVYGNYSEVPEEKEDYTGLTDTIPEYTPQSVYGFKEGALKPSSDASIQEKEEYTIKGDGTTVLKYYYEREKYTLTLNKRGDAPGSNYEIIIDNKKYTNIEENLSLDIYYDKEINIEIKPFVGINFVEWTSDNIKDLTNKVQQITMKANTSITYLININHYTIEYNGASGLTEENENKYIQDFIYDLTDNSTQRLMTNKFKRAGYKFIGWSKSENGSVDYQDNVIVRNLTDKNNEIVKLYAVWEINKNSVMFRSMNKTYVEYEEQALGSKIVKPEDPTLLGYTFEGWFLEDSITKWDFLNDTMPDERLVLYAKWSPNKYIVKFDKNGGIGDDYSQTLTYNEKDKLIENRYTKTGYTFEGWSLDKDGEIKYNNTDEVTNIISEGEITLYAVWKPIKYTVVYHSNNGKDETKESQFTYDGENKSLNENTFEKKHTITYKYNNGSSDKTTGAYNATLSCWKLKDSDNCYKPNEIITDNLSDTPKTVDLYAEWTNPTVELEQPKKLGYVFAGWMLDNEVIPNTYVLDKNITLTAKWTPIDYTVIYHSNNGKDETKESQFTYDGENISLDANTFEKKHTITYKYNNGSSEKTTDAYSATLSCWKLENSKKCYNPNEKIEDNLSTTDGKVNLYAEWIDPVVNLEHPEKIGYTFKGWSIDNNTVVKDPYTLSNDVTLNALWNPITYEIKYDGNGNTSGKMDNSTHTYDKESTLTKNEYKKVYKLTYDYNQKGVNNKTSDIENTFNGWLDKNGKPYKDGDTINNLTTIDGEIIILTAQWKNPTVTLDTPTRVGYTFDGWYIDDETKLLSGDYTLTKDTTLKAKWTPIKYNVVYKSNNDKEETKNDTFTYDGNNTLADKNTFTKSYTITYKYNYDKENKVDTHNATLSCWKMEGKDTCYKPGEKLTENLSSTEGTIILTAEWTNPKVTLEKPERDGYLFDGWMLDNNKVEDNYTLDKDIELSASWSPIKYNIHYDGNGATSGDMPNSTHTYDDSESRVSENTYKRIYKVTYDFSYGINNKEEEKTYTFMGWSKSKTGDVDIEDNGETGNLSNKDKETVTLYAKWQENSLDLEIPTRIGYTFDGWYDGNDKVESLKGLSKNITLKAKWIANSETPYTIKHIKMNIDGEYDEKDESLIETEELRGVTDSTVTPTPRNYPGFTTPTATPITINGDGTTTLVYKYDRNKYKVTINGDKGISDVPKTIEDYYEKTVNISVNVKDGYKFVAWDNAEETETTFKHKILDNITFTAKTTPIDYGITYKYNDGIVSDENPKTYNVESKITLNKPTKEGYTFKYWLINGQQSSNGVIENRTGALEVEAVFEENTMTIVYDSNVDNGHLTGNMQESTFKYTNESIKLPNNSFTKSYNLTYDYGYENKTNVKTYNAEFIGWSLKQTGNIKFENLQDITDYVHDELKSSSKKITLYAIWKNPVVTLEKPERENYVFYRWGSLSTSTNTYELNEDTTLVASWRTLYETDNLIQSQLNKVDKNLFKTTFNKDTNEIIVDMSLSFDSNNNVTNTLKDILDKIIKNQNSTYYRNGPVYSTKITYNGKDYTLSQYDYEDKINELFKDLTKTSNISNYNDRKLSSLYGKELTVTYNLSSNYTPKNSNKYTIKFTSDNVVSSKEYLELTTAAVKFINSHKDTAYEIVSNGNVITMKYINPEKSLVNDIPGSGIKTALFKLLGNEKEKYPDTFIDAITLKFRGDTNNITKDLLADDDNWPNIYRSISNKFVDIIVEDNDLPPINKGDQDYDYCDRVYWQDENLRKYYWFCEYQEISNNFLDPYKFDIILVLKQGKVLEDEIYKEFTLGFKQNN